MRKQTCEETSVLVVGGSLVGLSAAVFLASHGVEVIVAERHRGSSLHPRAIGYTTRTLELFDAVGISLPSSTQGDTAPRRAKVYSLTSASFEEYPWSPGGAQGGTGDYSPTRATAVAQDRLEPILRERATSLGADLRLGTEVVEFSQDAAGVTATLRHRDDDRQYQIRADYMIAADGADSDIRGALDINRSGRGLLSVQRSILFRAPLDRYLESGIVQFEITQPGLNGFLSTYSDGRWVLMLSDDRELSPDQQRDVIRQVVGDGDLPIDLITTGRWELAAKIADRFSRGRVFLVGDAAHQLPPNRGGYGANTGIEDAHNLAWKLAAVLAGSSQPALLDTYDEERRPIAWLRHDQLFARADYKAYVEDSAPTGEVIDDIAMELGQLYRSMALPNGPWDLPPARRPDEWAGQPGTRAPHLPVTTAHGRTSILELFQKGWVLLSESDRWNTAATAVTEDFGTQIDFVWVGTDITPEQPDAFRMAYGLQRDGATLVRPDGYIAWRTAAAPHDAVATLRSAYVRAATAAQPLESRLHRLEDVAAIVEVTNRYADAINHGYAGRNIDLQTIETVFADDATYFGIDGEDTVESVEAIVAEMPSATAAVSFAMHTFLNPVISITGDTASAGWLMWVSSVIAENPGAAYLSADMTYTHTDLGWRIQTVRVHYGMRLPSA
jgi:putative polyketide hydroxylase